MPSPLPGTSMRLPLLALLAAVYAWSALRPADVPTWWMEVAPVLVALPLVVRLDRRLGFTALALSLLAVEAVVVAVGAHYTYAMVPVGFDVSALLGLERNHYDRFAHFAQGFTPAVFVRELLLKTSPLRPGRWLFGIVAGLGLAFSALYELLEWWAAIAFAEGATAFLGTQGDPWDSQWDMFLALCGAVSCQALLGRVHDRQLATQAPNRQQG